MTKPITEEELASLQLEAADGAGYEGLSVEWGEKIARLIAEIRRLQNHERGFLKECDEITQVLGQVLGYPWFKDDQKNFPGATKDDGVCIGEHVPASLADEAANTMRRLQSRVKELEADAG